MSIPLVEPAIDLALLGVPPLASPRIPLGAPMRARLAYPPRSQGDARPLDTTEHKKAMAWLLDRRTEGHPTTPPPGRPTPATPTTEEHSHSTA